MPIFPGINLAFSTDSAFFVCCQWTSHRGIAGMLEILLLSGGALYTAFKAYQEFKKPTLRIPLPEHAPALGSRHRPSWISRQTGDAENITVATIAVSGAAASALLFPPLSLICLPTLLYLTAPYLWETYRALVHERRLSISAINVLIPMVCLFNGYYLAPSLGFWLTGCGRRFLRISTEDARQTIRQIFGELPHSASIFHNGQRIEVALAELQPSDLVIVKAGCLIPVDGVIVNGEGLIAQANLTGETQLAHKNCGDAVLASTIVIVGEILVKAEKVGAQTTVAQIQALLCRAEDASAHIFTGRKVGDQTVLPMVGLGVWAIFLLDPISAVALMNSRLGYDLAQLMPIAWLNFLKTTAQAGMLVKTVAVLPHLHQVDTILLNLAASDLLTANRSLHHLRVHGIDSIYVLVEGAPFPSRHLHQLGADNAFAINATDTPTTFIARLQAMQKCVCYVGDGIWDAAAMQQADISISVRGISAMAENQAQIISIDANLHRLSQLFHAAHSLEEQRQSTFQLTYTPGIINLAAVLGFQSGLLTSILLNSTGLLLGLRNLHRGVAKHRVDQAWASLRQRSDKLVDFAFVANQPSYDESLARQLIPITERDTLHS